MSTTKDCLLSPTDVAEQLGIARSSLRYWRAHGGGPAWVRLSGRYIRYRQSDVDAWIAAKRESAEGTRRVG